MPHAVSVAYIAASLLLAVTPGPSVLYIVTRSVSQGRVAGLASVLGIALGNLGNALIASVGLGALFAISTLAFSIVKYAGALYLIYMGLRTILTAPSPAAVPASGTPQGASWRRFCRDGFFVALLNPKTTIFFAAFVPQFLDQGAATVFDTLELSVVFVLIAACTDSTYALTASGARRLLLNTGIRMQRTGRMLSGGTFVALGLFTAVAGRQSKP